MQNDSTGIQVRLSDEELTSLYQLRAGKNIQIQGWVKLPEILDLFKSGKLIPFSATYKRSTKWTTIEKSRVIESFLINIPILPIVLHELEFGINEIIDGEQIIMSVVDFYSNNFMLQGLEAWKELNGMKYQNLPNKVKEGLNLKAVKTITLLIEPEIEFGVDAIKQATYQRLNNWRLT